MSLEAENTELRCGNCYEIVDVDGSMSSIRVCNNTGIETEDVEIIDAICYIYGISLEEIRTWTEQLKGPNSDLNDVHWLKGNSIHLCDFCAYALSDNYKAHKKFEQLSNGSSFVCQINKFRRGEWESLTMPIIKAEVDMALDSQGDGDEYSFRALNSDSEELDDENDAQVSDSASEIKYNPSRNVDKKFSKRALKKKAKLKKKKLHKRRPMPLKLEYMSDEDVEVFNLNAEKTPGGGNLSVETAESSKPNLPKVKTKGPFECDLCDKKFDLRGKLREHKRNHLKVDCKLCGKTLNSVTIARHIRVVHPNEEKQPNERVPCEICGALLSKLSMRSHMHYQHSGDAQVFKCETCGKTFVRKQNYEAHMLAHSEGFTPFLCGQCGKTFNCKSTLSAHEKTHLDKKFKCEICSKQFYIKGYLNKHMKEFHVTERKYICDECGKSYKSNRHLLVHKKQHKEMAEKGENSVQCDECGKNFKHSLSLYNHKLRNHRGKIYQCDLCGKTLSDPTCLRTHKKLVHKVFPKNTVSNPINLNHSSGISQIQIEPATEISVGLQQL